MAENAVFDAKKVLEADENLYKTLEKYETELKNAAPKDKKKIQKQIDEANEELSKRSLEQIEGEESRLNELLTKELSEAEKDTNKIEELRQKIDNIEIKKGKLEPETRINTLNTKTELTAAEKTELEELNIIIKRKNPPRVNRRGTSKVSRKFKKCFR